MNVSPTLSLCLLLAASHLAVFCFQITDACSACFEQRTVFTQQVLAKALGQMVSQKRTYL